MRSKEGETLLFEEHYKKGTRTRNIIVAVVLGLLVIGCVVAVVAWQVMKNKDPPSPAPPNIPTEPLARAQYLQGLVPLWDGHNDLPWQYRTKVNNNISALDISVLQPSLQTDIPRLREGILGAQFWSVYVPCNQVDPVQATMEQIDVVYRFVHKYPETFQMAFTSPEVQTAFNNKRIASLIGMEGGHSINNSLGALRMFHKLGARYMTLTHSCSTSWAQCAQDTSGNVIGLTSFGKDVVREMNRLGMLVDISHVAPATMHDALDTSVAPVIFSHSSVQALCNVVRNVPDDVLLRLPSNGGVIMIVFYTGFICPAPQMANCNLSNVADHIDYIKNLLGNVDNIGLGSDYDGVDDLPIGLEDVSKYVDLTAELVRRKYTDDEILQILSKNTMRVLARAEEVAKQLQNGMMVFPE